MDLPKYAGVCLYLLSSKSTIRHWEKPDSEQHMHPLIQGELRGSEH